MLKTCAVVLASLIVTTSFAAKNGYDYFGKKEFKPEVATSPSAPSLQTPANFSTVEGTAVQLSWAPVDGIALYRVIVATDPHFQFRVFDNYSDDSKSTVENLEPGMSYYWRVAGIAPKNNPGYTIGEYAKATFILK